MRILTYPLRTYPLISFTILACLFGWIQFIAAALGAKIAPEGMPLGPIIAAAIVAASMGRAGLKEWGHNLMTLRTSIGWYALAILAPVVIIIAAVWVNHAFGAPLPTPTQLAGWTQLPGELIAILIFIGIGEEAGWTAFAAALLLKRHPLITAWLILSAMRVLWHLPLMLSGDLTWTLGIGGNIAFQFLVLWMFKGSGGVWFLAAIWHSVLNTAGGTFFFPMVQGEDQTRLGLLMTIGYVLVAALVFMNSRRLDRIPRLGQQGV